MRLHAMLRLLQPMAAAALVPPTALIRSAPMSGRASSPIMQYNNYNKGGYNNNGYNSGYGNNGYNSGYGGMQNQGYGGYSNNGYSNNGYSNNGYSNSGYGGYSNGGMQSYGGYSGGMQGYGSSYGSSSWDDRPLGSSRYDYDDRYSSTSRYGPYRDNYRDRFPQPRSRYSRDYDDYDYNDRGGRYPRGGYYTRSDYEENRYLARNRYNQDLYDRYSRRGRSMRGSGDYYGPMSRRGYYSDSDSYDSYGSYGGYGGYGGSSRYYAPRSIAYSVMTGREDYDDRYSLLPANEAESVMSRSLHGTAVKDAEWREAQRRARRDGYDEMLPPQRGNWQMRLRPAGV